MNMMTPIALVEPVLTRTEVASLVSLAARTVPPVWPLESAIAVNPLAGFEELPFEQAVSAAAQRFSARESLPIDQWRTLLRTGRIDQKVLRDVAIQELGGLNSAFELIGPDVSRLDLLMARLIDLPVGAGAARPAMLSPDADFIAKWCAAFFDQGRAASPMPNRELGLYRSVLAMAGHDPEFRRLTGDIGQKLLLSIPRDPLEAIAEGFAALGIRHGQEEDLLAAYVARLPGWAGHIRWRNEHADPDHAAGAPAGMADLLALWMLLERSGAVSTNAVRTASSDVSAQLAERFNLTSDILEDAHEAGRRPFKEIANLDEGTLGRMFMLAAEISYRNAVVPQLRAAANTAGAEDLAEAQLVFCIDVRSEPFRRALEAQGRYETFGYAGFFGLPIALHKVGKSRRTRLLPVLLSPQHDVEEGPAVGHERAAEMLAQNVERTKRAGAVFDIAKQGSATAFTTAEVTGPLAGLLMAAKTIAPKFVERAVSRLLPNRADAFAPDLEKHADHGVRSAFTFEEKVGYATALFKLTGMKTPTARLVALVGHGGRAVNNPYAAALDCGACGGHAGGSNARILTVILNDPDVRAELVKRGISIPETTLFIAAEHNTTTDEVFIFDQAAISDSHRPDLGALIASLEKAGTANRERRSALLGRSASDVLTGAVHWGEVRPEWGLAGNAAFIVGPRSLTRAIDLEGRAFLHSYDWQSDTDGSALTTILTAPMVVAQWINCQYLFSTIDNDRYGSGNKITQNVVGGIGVLQGNGGDLKVGLPMQSLFGDDGSAFHVPQRLLTVVLAPFDLVESVVASNDILERLFGNGWVSLVVIDPETGKAMRWRRNCEVSEPAAAHQAS